MAIVPTGAIYKSLIFDGENSRDYGVYITGEAVYNAPERVVEMIAIPNRNGSFALDKGYFENIEVKYPAGMFAATEADFSASIAGFRNMLCSRKGYVRLEDEYNPNEYRMAIYKSGLEVESAQTAGEFEIIFECMPQRFLKSGENPVEVSDGDTLTNPTLFEAKPLILTEGFGTLSIDGNEIKVPNQLMGNTELQHLWRGNEVVDSYILATFYDKIPIPAGVANSGDTVTAGMAATVTIKNINTASLRALGTPRNVHVVDENGNTVTDATATAKVVRDNNVLANKIECRLTLPISYAYKAAYQAQTRNLHFTLEPTLVSAFDCYIPIKFWQRTVGNELQLIADIGSVTTDATGQPKYILENYTESRINSMNTDVRIESTAPAYGSPTYIDCERGEIYKETDGDKVSLNRYVSTGAKLPTLKENSLVEYDDFTDVQIIPRWWQI